VSADSREDSDAERRGVTGGEGGGEGGDDGPGELPVDAADVVEAVEACALGDSYGGKEGEKNSRGLHFGVFCLDVGGGFKSLVVG